MSHSTPEEPNLFDLPLGPPPAGEVEPEPAAEELEPEAPATRARRRRPQRPAPLETLSLFDDGAPSQAPRPEPSRRADARARPLAPLADEPGGEEPNGVALAARIRAAAGDLIVLAAVGALAATGARALGARIGAAELAPLALFLLSWSFLYSVIALAFWGQTPGMAWAGVLARGADGEPLSFGQTALRWVGGWLTWALLGLPGLLALTGASLADRLSGSRLYEATAPPSPASGSFA